ncbi:tryptophan 7-halogenase [Aliikangiella marina]|uniref:Tryptophan 7-halogenase n=1 Tax=Aliikangiella marina TaxID=1712262 RepID=A0A545T186_9GAMM|nr:tryptophan halogenase family protein [Aliikangiella marina]TQV70978.1 tryptophan 7-halogenase [Aliikangiella marina]
MSNNRIQKVVIVGGGSAGWMAGAALAKLLGKNLDISLIESEEIGRIGVGEATIPPLRVFNQLLGINEQDFMRSCQATFKLGIEFQNWGERGDSYIHSFGATGKVCWAGEFQHFWLGGLERNIQNEFGDYCLELKAAKAGKFGFNKDIQLNYAYHIDAGLYAAYLKRFAMTNGLKWIEGRITQVHQNTENGYIESVELSNGQKIAGDFFIDCSGFAAKLIEETLEAGFESYQSYLPCDSAVPVQTVKHGDPKPYTQAIAHDFGWQWRIPLQHRVGNGLVYCSEFASDETAQETIMSNLESEAITDPVVLKYKTGTRKKGWVKNCVAIGLSSGFLEPVESTAIHLIMSAVLRLMRLFPHNEISQSNVDEYNRQYIEEMERIRDFIILHYKATEREDSSFWQYCKHMTVPETLAHRMRLFKDTGRVCITDTELFKIDSWTQVMLGQRVRPDNYHQIVDMMPDGELDRFLMILRNQVDSQLTNMPTHQQFIDHYCKANPI